MSIPSSDPPSCAAYSMPKGPSIQRGKIEAVTRSPTATRLTCSPTATTSPAPSEIGMTSGLTGSGYQPRSTISSRKLSELARTWTRTSFRPGSGVSCSRTDSPSIPAPRLVW